MSMIYTWYRIEGVLRSELAAGKLLEVSAGNKQIGLLLKDDMIHAFAATCPHAGAQLCEGWLDVQGRIVCPLHKYRFDPKNGRNTSGEGYKLRTYPVEIREGYIYIGLQS